MSKLILCLVLIALVGSTEIVKRPKFELSEEQKKVLKVAVNKIALQLSDEQLAVILEWIKMAGCAVGPYACEMAFPEFAPLCAIGFEILCLL
jgi:hypothetical protein